MITSYTGKLGYETEEQRGEKEDKPKQNSKVTKRKERKEM